jgi:DNA end-binding protein Ku
MAGPTKVWKGFLTFGLLQIPVYLNTGAREKRVELHNYHRATADGEPCNGELGAPKKCKACGAGDLKESDIYKGYEGPNGIIPITKDELAAITPATEKVMEISEIVPLESIDPMYYNDAFYMLPDEAVGRKAYSLLLHTLIAKESAAIVRLTKSQREHIAAIRPKANGLVLSYLWHADEMNVNEDFEKFTPVACSEAEMNLAEQLADSLAADFNPDALEDSYRQRLSTLIASKLDKTIEPPAAVNTPTPEASVDLMAALKKSIATMPTKAAAPSKPAAKPKAKPKTKRKAA